MKRKVFLTTALLLIFSFAANDAAAQFEIKLPKFGKPKTEKPKTEQPTSEQPKTSDNRPAAQLNQSAYLAPPEPTNVPVLLLETLEIKAKNETRYWKTPNASNAANWYPQVSFDVFLQKGSPKLRFLAEWFNPNGSAWFSEPLEQTGSDYSLRSPYESKQFYENGVLTTGVYGLKITDTKTGAVHFQGKFKVSKMPIKEEVKTLFYVDNDWLLPIGYAGFNRNVTDYDVRTRPTVFFWFRGYPDAKQLEAELHFNNQKIATTDRGGLINRWAERGNDTCFQAREVCSHSLMGFEWENLLVDNSPNARQNSPNGYFTRDKPGEYTVKIYYAGEQVREAKFIVDQKGWIARNAFSEQIFLNDHRVAVPVKITGNLEKPNYAAWKPEAFYGNPLNGFSAP